MRVLRRQVGGNPEREPSLADAARSGEGQQTDVVLEQELAGGRASAHAQRAA